MNTKYKHIVYDVDDVLADFWGTVLPAMNEHFNTNVKVTDFVNYEKVSELFGITYPEFFDFLSTGNLMSELQPTSLVDMINNDYHKGHLITVISSRDYHPDAYEITKDWLTRNDIQHHNLYISGKNKKSSFVDGVDVVIDDHTKNIDDMFNADVMSNIGMGILVDRPWNQNYTRNNVIRISS